MSMGPSASGFGGSDFEELNSLEDNRLVELARGGDAARGREALSVLLSRYLRLVRKRACGSAGEYAEADDLAQEGFLAFLHAVNAFNPKRGTKFSSFADVCVTNGIKSAAVRLGKNAAETADGEAEENASDELSPENIWFEKEKMFGIYSEIASLLSEKEWTVFRLYLAGFSYGEISEMLGVSQKSVDNAVFRVRKKLKALFSRDGTFEM